MRGSRLALGLSIALLLPAGRPPARAQEPPARPAADPAVGPPAFAMSPAVACARVDGYEDFTPLPVVELTSLDKLKVYFRPLHFKYDVDPKNKAPYRVRFVEDGRIRRKGEKKEVAKEDKLLEYETRSDVPGFPVYLVNTIGLEKLTPGDYELDITLHDMVDGAAVAKQVLPFRVVPLPAGAAPPEPAPAKAEPPAGKRKKSAKGAGRPATAR